MHVGHCEWRAPPPSLPLFFSHTGGKSGTGGLLRPQTCRQLRLLLPTPPLHIKMNPERHVLLSPQERYRDNLLDCLKSFVGDINLEGGELPSTPGVACEIVEDATRFGLPDCWRLQIQGRCLQAKHHTRILQVRCL